MASSAVVVVGVDGSPGSRTALEFAAQQATQLIATLRVVSVFESSGIFGTRYGLPIPVTDDEIAKKIQEQVGALLDEVLGALPERPDAQLVVQAGDAGLVLTAESKNADLLVLAHSDVPGIVRTLLGSVNVHCVLNAHCTVAVVRPPRSVPAG